MSGSLGLLVGAVASFFLSKELHFESRQPLLVFPSSTGIKPQEAYTTVYPRSPNDFSYDVDGQNDECIVGGDNQASSRLHDDRNMGSSASNGFSNSTVIPISERIDSRKPFSVDSPSSSSSQQTRSTSAYSMHNSMYYNHDMLNSFTAHTSNRSDGEEGDGNILSSGMSTNSSCSTSDWTSRITQFNPFYSGRSRDKYERVPEPWPYSTVQYIRWQYKSDIQIIQCNIQIMIGIISFSGFLYFYCWDNKLILFFSFILRHFLSDDISCFISLFTCFSLILYIIKWFPSLFLIFRQLLWDFDSLPLKINR